MHVCGVLVVRSRQNKSERHVGRENFGDGMHCSQMLGTERAFSHKFGSLICLVTRLPQVTCARYRHWHGTTCLARHYIIVDTHYTTLPLFFFLNSKEEWMEEKIVGNWLQVRNKREKIQLFNCMRQTNNKGCPTRTIEKKNKKIMSFIST